MMHDVRMCVWGGGGGGDKANAHESFHTYTQCTNIVRVPFHLMFIRDIEIEQKKKPTRNIKHIPGESWGENHTVEITKRRERRN